MSNNFNEKSIKETLGVIRKALEDENLPKDKSINETILLNQLIKKDGTIKIINKNSINQDIKKILDEKNTVKINFIVFKI